MGKRFVAQPLEHMEIEFWDKTLDFCFDMKALTVLQNEFGDLEKLLNANKDKPYDLVGMMFYSGVKPRTDITLDEANVIIANSAEIFAETMRLVFLSLPILGGKDVAKKIREELEKQNIVKVKTL